MPLKKITRIPNTKLPDNRYETIAGMGGASRGPEHEHPMRTFSQEEKDMYHALAPLLRASRERESSG